MPAVVTVTHAPVEHVGDSLESAVGRRGEAFNVVFGLVGAELIEQQERIKIRQIRAADETRQGDSRPVGCGHSSDDALNLARGTRHPRTLAPRPRNGVAVQARRMRFATKLKAASARNTKNSTFAMPTAPAAIPPKPNTAAMSAMMKNTTA